MNIENDSHPQSILKKFNLTEKDLIGAGGEAIVYRLNDQKILRILRGNKDKRWKLEKLQSFYEGLPKMSFTTPAIHSVDFDEEESVTYSIENMILGRPVEKILPNLSRKDKEEALFNYLVAVEELKQVTYPQLPYGDLLSKELLTSGSWSGFLSARIRNAIGKNGLENDVPNLGEVAELTYERVNKIHTPEKSLVHGDYFPDNVLMDEELNVTSIIDFSPMTLVGDSFMDVAGSLIFLEVADGYVPENSQILHEIITSEYGDVDEAILTYRLYYSFYFSGPNVKEHVPKLYQWCIDNLNKVPGSY
jgi:hypothetical protein